MAPYCAIPRDYLSDTPCCALWGFWCLNMANWVRYPLPFSKHAKWRCDNLPSKGVPERYLRDTLRKQGQNPCNTPLCDTISKGYCAIWGGISHWAAFGLKCLKITEPALSNQLGTIISRVLPWKLQVFQNLLQTTH